jgi:hypothetical protein
MATTDNNETIKKLVDEALSGMSGRDLVSSSEITDLLLDIRLHLLVNEVATSNI